MRRWLDRLRGRARQPRHRLPEALWQATLDACAYLRELPPPEQERLRDLATFFLEDKEFHGAQGLQITDAMALTIAVQACLPVLHFGPGE